MIQVTRELHKSTRPVPAQPKDPIEPGARYVAHAKGIRRGHADRDERSQTSTDHSLTTVARVTIHSRAQDA